MKQYVVQKIQKRGSTALVTLKPRRSRDRLQFHPGQYAAVGFRGANGRPTPLRCFSIASSPFDADVLQFGIKIDGDFTRAFTALEPGQPVSVRGPFGSFVIDERYDRRLVLLAGGIGITPFMSMVRALAQSGSTLPVTLLHSVRDSSSVPFHDELTNLAQQNPYFDYRMFVTDPAGSSRPEASTGRITEQDIRSASHGYAPATTYFLCGPPNFVRSMDKVLTYNHIDPARILSESFTQSTNITTGSGMSLSKLTYAVTGGILAAGIVGIAGLDLSRYVPSHVTSAPVAAAQAAATTSRNSDDTATTDDESAAPTTTSPSPAPTATQAPTPSPQPQPMQYRQPMSTVS